MIFHSRIVSRCVHMCVTRNTCHVYMYSLLILFLNTTCTTRPVYIFIYACSIHSFIHDMYMNVCNVPVLFIHLRCALSCTRSLSTLSTFSSIAACFPSIVANFSSISENFSFIVTCFNWACSSCALNILSDPF